MTAIASRLARLEARFGGNTIWHKRAFECIVRKGHEDEDRAQAFGQLGIEPDDEDLVVLRVIVGASGGQPVRNVEPRARRVV